MLSILSCLFACRKRQSTRVLTWRTPWTEEPGGPQSLGSKGVRQDSATSLSLFTFMHWRRKWQPIPVFLPGKSQGQGSLVGCRLWVRTELDPTERLSSSSSSASCSVMSDSLQPHESQHARPPCPSPTPGVHSDSRPSPKINIFKSLFKSKFTQTHVHRVSDAIQPSHPLLSPSPPAPNPQILPLKMSSCIILTIK